MKKRVTTSGDSSEKDGSREDGWTNDPLTTWVQPSLGDTGSVIFSPALPVGQKRCGWQRGLTNGRSGQGAAPASRSPKRGNGRAQPMSGTCGQCSKDSSRSAVLQSSLESRLRARTEGIGSPMYGLKWKRWDMRLGPPICALRASPRRISDRGCTLWGWPTPTAGAGTGPGTEGRQGGLNLQTAAAIAGWPTPTVTDANRGRGTIRPHDTGIPLPQRAALAGWPTPQSSNGDKSVRTQTGAESEAQRKGWGNDLGTAAWSTAATNPARLTTSGELLTGSGAGMKSGGLLSPEHSRWLMGYRAGWLPSGDTETPSSLSVPQSSSSL